MKTSNADNAIAEWRREMIRAGMNVPETLDELESHLREEYEWQMLRGAEETRAFDAAVQKIGTARSLKNEFDKTNQTKIMKRIFIISAGVVGILVGMAFVMPAVAQYRHEGAMTHQEVWLLLLGMVLTIGGVGAALLGIKRRPA